MHKYYDMNDLVDRLCNAAHRRDKTVTFLVGSPVSMPDFPGGRGVPGVSGMIDLIERQFEDDDARNEFKHYIKDASMNRYQRAFEFLQGRRGQDAANSVVRSAVWQALNLEKWPSHLPETLPAEASSAICGQLERTVDAWLLPKAADEFGRLLVT